MLKLYKRFAVAIFGKAADKYAGGFRHLQSHLETSGLRIMYKTYLCMTFLSSVVAFFGTLIILMLLPYFIEIEAFTYIYLLIFSPVLIGGLTFTVFYFYPMQKSSAIKKSLENDLPFALAHMSAIASAGISPEYMFELLTGFREFRGISRQASQIVRNIKTFGMSSVSAINAVADRSPSATFKQILIGITYTIEKGGNLVEYLREMSGKSLFDYRIRREKYLKTLSTYADIYTALLVAAPLMLLAVLGILSIIGGEVLGLTIPDLITLITFLVLPALNISFIAFIHMTYPGL